jgi:hypothetical protein
MENLLSLPVLQSCALCLGGADGEIAIAANFAIGLMLIFVFGVLGSFGGFIFYLGKKARAVAAEDLTLNGDLSGYNQ